MINEANEPSSACRLWRLCQVETSTPPLRKSEYDWQGRSGQAGRGQLLANCEATVEALKSDGCGMQDTSGLRNTRQAKAKRGCRRPYLNRSADLGLPNSPSPYPL